MIDVHVLTYSGTDPAWLGQCLDSLAAEPCTVHVLEGVEGSVGQGRAKGYQLGTHEFVSYVDSDDYVLPGVMRACLSALTQHRAVVTRERRLWGTLFDSSKIGGHHLAVYRRKDVLQHLDTIASLPYHCDQVLLRELSPRQLDILGYVWRMHGAQGHRRCTPDHRNAMEELWRK